LTANAEFWQQILALEYSATKSRALLEELGSFDVATLDRRKWTASEERRLKEAKAADLNAAFRQGIRLVTEPDYPTPLAEAPGSPVAIFAHGDLSCLDRPTVAIVGTRNASTYGRACAQKIAEALAINGVTVVSGGALGIDAAAHEGALKAGGSTVAVFAGGIDYTYPRSHEGLFRRIVEGGCLVSQFAVGRRPTEWHFLTRNTLIAMLSLAVVVVEAPPKSGALHTANAANELGRPVFVISADIDKRSFRGSLDLIRAGAGLVYHPAQILEDLGFTYVAQEVPQSPVTELSARILQVLTTTPLSTEKIAEAAGVDTATLLAELTMLELEGKVIRGASGYAKQP
jgi:DNA processing protein